MAQWNEYFYVLENVPTFEPNKQTEIKYKIKLGQKSVPTFCKHLKFFRPGLKTRVIRWNWFGPHVSVDSNRHKFVQNREREKERGHLSPKWWAICERIASRRADIITCYWAPGLAAPHRSDTFESLACRPSSLRPPMITVLPLFSPPWTFIMRYSPFSIFI